MVEAMGLEPTNLLTARLVERMGSSGSRWVQAGRVGRLEAPCEVQWRSVGSRVAELRWQIR